MVPCSPIFTTVHPLEKDYFYLTLLLSVYIFVMMFKFFLQSLQLSKSCNVSLSLLCPCVVSNHGAILILFFSFVQVVQLLHFSLTGSPRSSTTLCWPRLASTTTPETTSSWELPVESTSGCAPSPSQTPEIQTSSGPCPKEKHKRNFAIFVTFFKISLIQNCWKNFVVLHVLNDFRLTS